MNKPEPAPRGPVLFMPENGAPSISHFNGPTSAFTIREYKHTTHALKTRHRAATGPRVLPVVTFTRQRRGTAYDPATAGQDQQQPASPHKTVSQRHTPLAFSVAWLKVVKVVKVAGDPESRKSRKSAAFDSESRRSRKSQKSVSKVGSRFVKVESRLISFFLVFPRFFSSFLYWVRFGSRWISQSTGNSAYFSSIATTSTSFF